MIAVERVDFIGVPVRDLAEADSYFAETLDLFERNPGSTERWVEYEAPNVTLALIPNEYTGGKHEPLPFASVVVRVDDVEQERRQLEGRGVEFVGDGFDSGVCNLMPFLALDGNGMMLHRRYAPFADGRSPEAARGRVDFVAVPVRDRAAAEEFYGRLLGLDRNAPTDTWVEYETGNLTLAFVDPATAGQEFKPLPGARSRCASRTSRQPRPTSRPRGRSFPPGSSTPACATSHRSRIRRGTA